MKFIALSSFCLFAAFSAFAQTPQAPRDYFQQRRALEEQLANQRREERTQRQHDALFAGFRKIAGRGTIDYQSSSCVSNWNAYENGQQVAQLCDSNACIPVFGRPSSPYEGFISWCKMNLTNGWQCKGSFGFRNETAVYGAYCMDANLTKHNFVINAMTGAVKAEGVSPRPR